VQLLARSIALAYNNLPRPHRVMLGSLTVVTLAVAVWKPFVYHTDQDSYQNKPIAKQVLLDTQQVRSLLPEASEPIDDNDSPPATDIPQDELDDKTENETGVHEYVVSTGDTLSSILNQYGIDMSDISALARKTPICVT